MSAGIYKITNLVTGMAYIGQSSNIENRWKREIAHAFQPHSKEYNHPRSFDFRKYGIDKFSFEILEFCDKDKATRHQREIFYINKYNTIFPKGYNLTIGGSHACSRKISFDEVQQIIALLKTTSLTHQKIGKQFNVSENIVCGINTGYYWFLDNETYPIRKKRVDIMKEEPTTVHACPICGAPIVSTSGKHCVACASQYRRKVERPSKEKLLEEVAILGFSKTAKQYGVSDKALVKWCKSYGLPIHKQDIVNLYRSFNNEQTK